MWIARPAVVAQYPTWLTVVLLGQDRALHKITYDGKSWGNVENLGGVFAHPPSLVSWNSKRFDMFGTGGDGAIYHKWWVDGNGWGPNGITGEYQNLGGTFFNQPKAVAWGPNRIDLFAIGVQGTLRHKYWDGASWGPKSGWDSLGSLCTGIPEVVSWGPERLDVFVFGKSTHIFHRAYDSTGWQAWEDMGGFAVGERVTAVCWGRERIDLFHLGADSNVHHRAYTPQMGWKPSSTTFESLGGIILSRVASSS